MNKAARALDPERLVNLLTQQRDLYLRLQELSERQRSMIAGDRPELLLNILRDRQDLVTSLARLNDELAPYRRHWDDMYRALPDAQRDQASTLLQEINGLLRVILRTDQEDGALLSARKQAVAAGLTATAGGQTANSAYAKGGASSPASASDITG
jgi:hypothetical protein